MKIWYLSAYDQPNGQSPRTYEFALELTKRGHKVSFFTNSLCHFTKKDQLNFLELRRIEFIEKIKVIWLKTTPYRGNGITRGINMMTNFIMIFLNGIIIRDQPDVIIGPSCPIFTGFCGYLLSKIYKVPFVYEVRDVWPDNLVENRGLNKEGLVYLIFKKIEILLYKRSKFISSALPFLYDHVRSCNADPNKIIFIPNGIDISKVNLKENYSGGDSNNLNVLYVGGFSFEHDVESIIRSAHLLQKMNDSRFKFTIIGDGINKENCLKLAESFKLRNLIFKDPIKKKFIYDVQSKADILIASIKNSNSYRFGLNLNKICTYLASARPIIISGNPPNDLVKESKGGLSVEAENPQQIVTALINISLLTPKQRLEMGERGRRYAEKNISIQKLTERMENMLNKAIKS